MPESSSRIATIVPATAKSSPVRPRTRFGQLVDRVLPSLAFERSLEQEYCRWYAAQVHGRIRNLLLLPVAAMLLVMFAGGPFGDLRSMLFGGARQSLIDIARFGLILPGCALLLAVTYSKHYTRWYALVAQIVLPLQALSLILLDASMAPQGYSLSLPMLLLALAPYFLLGVSRVQALRTVALILAAYAAGAGLSGAMDAQHVFELAVMASASVAGAVLHYSLQKSLRQNYLATRSMSESLNRDALTGIHNRRMFDEHASRMWQQASRTGSPVALLMIDIDHFKSFNDYGGHQAGDSCLIKVAAVLNRAARRPLDLAARYGGEEFSILLYDTRRENVEELCEELHASLASLNISHPAFTDGQRVTFSIGAACVEPLPERRVEGLIQLADEALYSAKERGRNRTVIMDREYETLRTGVFRVKRRDRSLAA